MPQGTPGCIIKESEISWTPHTQHTEGSCNCVSNRETSLYPLFFFFITTRSRIGIQLKDDSIVSVYHHWDGYPAWLGKVLNSKFNTKEKVTDLIDGGDISCAWSDSDWDRNDIETNRPLYYAGRGDSAEPQHHESITSISIKAKDSWGEYAYIFNEGEWFCYDTNDNCVLVDIPEGGLEE